MSENTAVRDIQQSDAAMRRALGYKIISLLFSDPCSLKERVEDVSQISVEVAGILSSMPAGGVRQEFERTFGHSLNSAFPLYETMYGKENIFQQSSELADISGFYNSWGLTASGTSERLDHIATEAEFMSFMCTREAMCAGGENARLITDAQKKFVNDHMGRWACLLGKSLKEKAASALYREAGSFLADFIDAEIKYLGVNPSRLRGIDVRQFSDYPLSSCFECPSSKDCFAGTADLEEEIS